MSTRSEQMQQLIDQYRHSGGHWPATAREMAQWAIEQRLWRPKPSQLLDQCADQIAKALRDEYVTDPQGRRVRTKHAATYQHGAEQFVLWDDIRTAPAKHMARAFQQRRQQILGDCKQLKCDVDSFNENYNADTPIQMIFDFTLDLEEFELLRKAA